MELTTIGKRIAELRKEKGVRQEDLAQHVGVTAQAVSKWENGGVPDTELLPGIAEYFGVSIDTLFGRGSCFGDIQEAIFADITGTREEERISRAFELCWMIQQSIFGKIFSDPETLKQEAAEHHPNDQVYSRILSDHGYTEMGLFNRMQYFLAVPETADKEKALLDGIDYPPLFGTLSDPAFFNTLLFLHRREGVHSFTEKLLMRELGLPEEKAKQIIGELLRWHLLGRTEAEIDDQLVELYQFRPRPSFTSMLIFAREMIDVPNHFYVNYDGRRKPYLK
ncbi:MAG: helix-turn-helix transcriptional regulator [Ruminococcaceae bacterium]|nr:helix-turn-helix transcriptional regulator [Oscillospiraceae bacterium]